jgi:hypothetical protein
MIKTQRNLISQMTETVNVHMKNKKTVYAAPQSMKKIHSLQVVLKQTFIKQKYILYNLKAILIDLVKHVHTKI